MRARNQTLPAAAAVLFAAVACAEAQKQTTYVPAYFLTNVYLHDATTTPLHVRITNAAADVSGAAVAGSNFTAAAAVAGSNYTATAAGNATNYTQAAAVAASNYTAAATNYLATNSLPALAVAGSNYAAVAAVAGSNYVATAAVAGSNFTVAAAVAGSNYVAGATNDLAAGFAVWYAASNNLVAHTNHHEATADAFRAAGAGATASKAVTIGAGATAAEAGIALGENAAVSGDGYGVAIGAGATENGVGGAALGFLAASRDGGAALGYKARGGAGAALGYEAVATADGSLGGTPINAIQFGQGANTNPSSFQVYSYPVLSPQGKIPRDRLDDGYNLTNLPLNSGFANAGATFLSFTNASRLLVLHVTNPPARLTINNERWLETSTNWSAVLDDVEGPHYFYVDKTTAAFTYSRTAWDISGEAQVAAVYWDADNDRPLIVSDERHGNSLTDAAHRYVHFTFGAQWRSGLQIIANPMTAGTPAANGSNTAVAVTPGVFADDDLEMTITSNRQTLGGPSYLTATTTAARIPVLYVTGTTAAVCWRQQDVGPFPFAWDAANRPLYNVLAGGAWSNALVPEDAFFVTWVFATDDVVTNPVKAISHHTTYTTLGAATTGAVPESIFIDRATGFSPEIKLLYRLIFLKNETVPAAFDVAVKYARLVQVTDYRYDDARPLTATPAQSHSSLTDLGVDSHLQYALADGTRNPPGMLTNVLGSGDATATNEGGSVTITVNVSPRIASVADRVTRNAQAIGEVALGLEAAATWATFPYSQFLADYYTDTNWTDAAGSTGVTYDAAADTWALGLGATDGRLVFRYLMNDSNATTTVTDISGKGANATATRNTANMAAPGKINGALTGNGASDKITVATPNLGSMDWGVAFWAYWTRTNAQENIIHINGHTTSRGSLYVAHLANSATLNVVSFADNQTQYNLTNLNAPYTTGEWIHYAITREGGYFKLYTNGTFYGSNSCTWAMNYENGTSYILANGQSGGAQFTTGRVDDVRLYTNAITFSMVTNIYNGGAGNEALHPFAAGVLKSRGFGTVASNNTVAVTILADRGTIPAASNFLVAASPDNGSTYSNLALTAAGQWPADTNYFKWTGRSRFATYGTAPVYRVTWSNSDPAKVKGVIVYVEDTVE